MRLYYHPQSRCSLRALLTATHLGVPVDLVVIDLFKGEQHSPPFLRLNPNHRVPVLEDDGCVLWESYAIMQYLSDKSPGQTLYPADVRARTDVNRWLFWGAQDFAPGVSILNWENSIKGMIGQGAADPTEVRRGERLFLESAAVLDAHLAGRDWICGSALSLADFAVAAPLADADRAQIPVGDFRQLQRWLANVQSLDAWKRNAL